MKYQTINYIPFSYFTADEDERFEMLETLNFEVGEYVNLVPIKEFIHHCFRCVKAYDGTDYEAKLILLMKKAEDVANNIAGPENLHIRIDN
jgi:hypothetical protein